MFKASKKAKAAGKTQAPPTPTLIEMKNGRIDLTASFKNLVDAFEFTLQKLMTYRSLVGVVPSLVDKTSLALQTLQAEGEIQYKLDAAKYPTSVKLNMKSLSALERELVALNPKYTLQGYNSVDCDSVNKAYSGSSDADEVQRRAVCRGIPKGTCSYNKVKKVCRDYQDPQTQQQTQQNRGSGSRRNRKKRPQTQASGSGDAAAVDEYNDLPDLVP